MLKTATQFLTDLAKRPEDEYPSAVGRVREGLDETLTVLTLHLSTRLQRSLGTTNAAESLLSRTRHMKRNVKRSTSKPLEGMVEVPVVVHELRPAAHDAQALPALMVARLGVEFMSRKQRQKLPEDCGLDPV